MKWLPFYLYGFTNIISFLLFASDKRKAKKGTFRIPEKVLITSSFFGPVGALTGMYLLHHKAGKNKFRITVPLFFILQVIIAFLLLSNGILKI